jgi:hypothetical protein
MSTLVMEGISVKDPFSSVSAGATGRVWAQQLSVSSRIRSK